jgi:5,10-methylenetetrahydromethanopterin reductase
MIFNMTRIGVALIGRIPMKEMVEVAKEADERGYHSIWLTEGNARDAFSQIAAMSMVTKNINFGPGVVVTYGRSPTMLAMVTATLAEISGNRFIQGIGAGGPSSENNHGEKYERPLSRMRDYITIIKTALRGETINYTGKIISIHGFKLGFTPPRSDTPVFIAALGPQMSKLGGEIADGLIYSFPTPDYIKNTIPIIKAGAEKSGRSMKDIDIAAYLLCDANPNEAKAIESIRAHIFGYTGMPAYINMMRLMDYNTEMDAVLMAREEGNLEKGISAISDKMVNDIGMYGNTESWPDKIEKFLEAGVTLPILRPANPITTSAQLLKNIVRAYKP